MSQAISKTSWVSLLLVVLLAVSTINAHPIRQTEETKKGLGVRSPRLIPDTEEYVRTILQGFGLEEPAPTPTSTSTPIATPNASTKTNQDLENTGPTQTTHMIYSSSVSHTPTYSSNGASYTQTVENEHTENQIGNGWNGGKNIEDFTKFFQSIYKLLEHRLKDMIDSSDEIGLENFV
ncbi:hypothetical protein N7463_010481 [Penicillium fimorum]|uniref:Uncharacterized protein n=1 Tax=Penicillium fimorum TaxID=1882269 RepID=A0A9X0C1V6_9EURO|nr:hypothetical protein N7463_010481 [Penicillium fimorum]